jgi:hypothetical protein
MKIDLLLVSLKEYKAMKRVLQIMQNFLQKRPMFDFQPNSIIEDTPGIVILYQIYKHPNYDQKQFEIIWTLQLKMTVIYNSADHNVLQVPSPIISSRCSNFMSWF